jgi:hypothetical protein
MSTIPVQDKAADSVKMSIGAFGLSLILHVTVLLVVGGYVIYEGVVPKTPFEAVSGPVASSLDQEVMPEPESVDPSEQMPVVNSDLLAPAQDSPVMTDTSEAAPTDLIVANTSGPSPWSLPSPAASAPIASMPSQDRSKDAPQASRQVVMNLFGARTEANRIVVILDASLSPSNTERAALSSGQATFLNSLRTHAETVEFAILYMGGLVNGQDFSRTFFAPQGFTIGQWLRPDANTVQRVIAAWSDNLRRPGTNPTGPLTAAYTMKPAPDRIVLLTEGVDLWNVPLVTPDGKARPLDEVKKEFARQFETLAKTAGKNYRRAPVELFLYGDVKALNAGLNHVMAELNSGNVDTNNDGWDDRVKRITLK